MNCENNFCIYCDEGKCILQNISINNIGMCDECILINLNDEILKEKNIR